MKVNNYNISVSEGNNGRLIVDLTLLDHPKDNKLHCEIRTHWWITGILMSWLGKAVQVRYIDKEGKEQKKYINIGSLFKRVYCPKTLQQNEFDLFYKKIREAVNKNHVLTNSTKNKTLTIDECINQLNEFLKKKQDINNKINQIWKTSSKISYKIEEECVDFEQDFDDENQLEEDLEEDWNQGIFSPQISIFTPPALSPAYQPTTDDYDKNIIQFLRDQSQPASTSPQATAAAPAVPDSSQSTDINGAPIANKFTSITSIEEQRQAHEKAKQYMTFHLQAMGAEVFFVSPEELSDIPNVRDIAIQDDMDPEVFCWDNTQGIQGDIQADGKIKDKVVLYGVESQFNGCESPGKYTLQPGAAVATYETDNTQDPQIQLQFPAEQVEIINNGANLGFNGLSQVLSEGTKGAVAHGYFTPSAQTAKQAIAELRENGHKIEYLCIGNIPKGQGNEQKVYEMLVAAPAFGRYNVHPSASKEDQEEIQFLCALHGFRAQFQQAIFLAKEKEKPVVFKPAGVGLDVYGNDPAIVAKAFYLAAKEFQEELKENYVEVHFQVFHGTGKSRDLVEHLGLPTQIMPPQQFLPDDMLRLNSLLKKDHSGADNAFIFRLDSGAVYYAWYNPQYNAINIEERDDFNPFSPKDKVGFHLTPAGKTLSVWINGQPYQGKIPDTYFPRIEAAFDEVIRKQTKIDGLNIRVVRNGMRRNIDFIFETFGNQIFKEIRPYPYSSYWLDPKIKVIMVNDDLSEDCGNDAGGLGRTFINELFLNVAMNKLSGIKCIQSGGVARPKAKTVCDSEKPNDLKLNPDEERQYLLMGQIFMYCYNSTKQCDSFDKTYCTGKYFDPSLFTAALSLSSSDLAQPFEQLSLEKKRELSMILFERDESQSRMKYFLHANPASLADDDIEEVKAWADPLSECSEDTTTEDIRQHWDLLIIPGLEKNIVDLYMPQLLPIHAIARGMQSLSWVASPQGKPPQAKAIWDSDFVQKNRDDPTFGVNLSEKIQGTIDRKVIAEQIKWKGKGQPSAAIKQKIDWLKEWIQDEGSCSEADVSQFVKFVTGCSSLILGKEIQVKERFGRTSPFPDTHTCDLRIELSPQFCGDSDNTKEKFIKKMREAMAVTKFDCV